MPARAITLRFILSVLILAICWVVPPARADTSAAAAWGDFDEAGFIPTGERVIVPAAYRAVALDWAMLGGRLATALLETEVDLRESETVISLPLPDGGFGRFRVVESPIMEPALAARFPEIRTYSGQGIDDPSASVRFDRTPRGFHAAVLSPSGSFYIDPYSQGDVDRYISYWVRDAWNPTAGAFTCGVTADTYLPRYFEGGMADTPSGSELRTYRTAVAATGEYTAFHGGTVALGQAAIVTAMNRVNGVYEREVAIRMTLVANNSSVVYTNGATDPYTNNNGFTMLGENQANLDAVIGNANYDIGHVFSTGGGGVASLGVPCVTGLKARGVTGLPSPTGDPFYIDFVAHEMGHQWGGNHTFNGSSGNCSGGNRNGSTAYEPGSGSTIMAYAGICSPQNLQQNSDDYFHGVSFDEMVAYSTAGSGNACPVITATGNEPPVVTAGASWVIPLETPFELCGAATDPNSDPLTFNWEQFDLGPAGHPNSPTGDAPIFRSFTATESSCRNFPQLSDLLNNTQTLGEILPTYARTMHFRLTARDNRSGGGGVDFDQSTIVEASAVGGPFLVTAPNTAVTWNSGDTETVAWDVAGTTSAPISCADVDILISSDGGTTYPHEVELGTANDGTESITVPGNIPSTVQARLRVQCSTSVFFDISNADFEIVNTGFIFADGFESGDTSSWSVTLP